MNTRKTHIIIFIIAASLFLHIVALWLGETLLAGWRWQHEPVHASVEIAGSLIAFYVGLLLLNLERYNSGTSHNYQIAAALFSMGTFDAAHALTYPGQSFVFLHSLATFYGGLLFVVICLPSAWQKYFGSQWLVATLLVAVATSITVLLEPSWVPTMVTNGQFTDLAHTLNMCGGLLLLAASVKLYLTHRRDPQHDDMLFILHCAMFGLAATMFQQSSLWDVSWWGWHVLRFIAYGVALWFAYRSDLEGQAAIFKSKKRLEKQHLTASSALHESLKKLAEQRNLQDAILEGINEALIMITEQGEIVLFNKTASELLGYSDQEVIGKNINCLMSQEHAAEHDHYLKFSTFNKQYDIIGKERDLQALKKDGSLFPVEIKVSRISLDKRGYFIGLLRDISARKQLENQLRQSAISAEEASKAKSEFLASMSHEIRTPLNGVLGMLELMANKDLDDDSRKKIKIAKESATGLLAIINDILDLSKIESGKIELEVIDFNLHDTLCSALETFSVRAHQKGLELAIDLSGLQTQMVKGDAGRLRQIVNNLLNNAIKFTELGQVVLRAKTILQDDQVYFHCAIEDSGIGIDNRKTESLFDSFTQADSSTTRKYGGTGLGLTICRKLCHLMGGSISVTSTLGEGSVFSFNLLLHPSQQQDTTKDLRAAMPEGMRALIIDDNAINLEIFANLFTQWQIETITTDRVDQAISCCEEQGPFDVILVDLNMPTKDGYEFARAYQRLNLRQPTPLLLTSSSIATINQQQLQELGFIGNLIKPVAPNDLYAALQLIAGNKDLPFITEHLLQSRPDLKSAPSRSRLNNSCRVLLVEDNMINQEVALEMLTELGLIPEVAGNGLEAIEALKRSQRDGQPLFDLIIMDCQMPEMNGFEASTNIRLGKAGKAYQKTPIIALTANALSGDREQCIAAGMNDYLTKPISQAALSESIDEWLSSREYASQAQYIDSWDKAILEHRFKGDQDKIAKAITMFQKYLNESIQALHESVKENDFALVQSTSEGLLASAKIVGANAISHYCTELAQAAGQEQENEISQLIQNIKKEQQTLNTEMRAAS